MPGPNGEYLANEPGAGALGEKTMETAKKNGEKKSEEVEGE